MSIINDMISPQATSTSVTSQFDEMHQLSKQRRNNKQKIEKSNDEFKEHERIIMDKRIAEINSVITKKCHLIWQQFMPFKTKPHTLQFNFVYHGLDHYLKKCDGYKAEQHKDSKQKWWNNQKASEMSQQFLPCVLNSTDHMAQYLGKQMDPKLQPEFTNYVTFELLETAMTSLFSTGRSGSNEVFLRTSFQYAKAGLRKKLVGYFGDGELRQYDTKSRKKKDLWQKLIKEKKERLLAIYHQKRALLSTDSKVGIVTNQNGNQNANLSQQPIAMMQYTQNNDSNWNLMNVMEDKSVFLSSANYTNTNTNCNRYNNDNNNNINIGDVNRYNDNLAATNNLYSLPPSAQHLYHRNGMNAQYAQSQYDGNQTAYMNNANGNNQNNNCYDNSNNFGILHLTPNDLTSNVKMNMMAVNNAQIPFPQSLLMDITLTYPNTNGCNVNVNGTADCNDNIKYSNQLQQRAQTSGKNERHRPPTPPSVRKRTIRQQDISDSMHPQSKTLMPASKKNQALQTAANAHSWLAAESALQMNNSSTKEEKRKAFNGRMRNQEQEQDSHYQQYSPRCSHHTHNHSHDPIQHRSVCSPTQPIQSRKPKTQHLEPHRPQHQQQYQRPSPGPLASTTDNWIQLNRGPVSDVDSGREDIKTEQTPSNNARTAASSKSKSYPAYDLYPRQEPRSLHVVDPQSPPTKPPLYKIERTGEEARDSYRERDDRKRERPRYLNVHHKEDAYHHRQRPRQRSRSRSPSYTCPSNQIHRDVLNGSMIDESSDTHGMPSMHRDPRSPSASRVENHHNDLYYDRYYRHEHRYCDRDRPPSHRKYSLPTPPAPPSHAHPPSTPHDSHTPSWPHSTHQYKPAAAPKRADPGGPKYSRCRRSFYDRLYDHYKLRQHRGNYYERHAHRENERRRMRDSYYDRHRDDGRERDRNRNTERREWNVDVSRDRERRRHPLSNATAKRFDRTT